MNRKTSFLPASLACLMAAGSASALAAPPTYHAGDLLMGFRVAGGAGAGQCYVVNIGAAATYRDATVPFAVANLGDINADLQAYGATWQTRNDLTWGIAGSPSNVDPVLGDPATTLYFSRSQSSAGVPGTLPFFDSETTRATISTRVTGFQSGFWDVTFNGGTPGVAPHTTHSDFASFQGDGDAYAWRLYMSPGGQSSYTQGGDFGALQNIEAIPTKTLSLFRFVDNGAASYEGYFSISSSAVLTFTPFIPQTYASWAAANVNNQPATDDFDHDGVQNGIEFFMGGSPTGFDENPQPVSNVITWSRAFGRDSTPVVQISTDLVTWTTATTGVNIGSSSVSYTITPGQPKQFVRLKVTP